ncbi:hypothetical protein FRB90_001980 [Tulasnella sp. 427]|nr:hypothetical protein FRB90_001980 [Tulasnella sp. 427]
MSAQPQYTSNLTDHNAGAHMAGLALPRLESALSAPTSQKRQYLKALSHEELVNLLIAVDADRTTVIFPNDIQAATANRLAERSEQSSSSVILSTSEPDVDTNVSPPQTEPAASTPPPFAPAHHPQIPPHAALSGPGNPFMPFLPPHLPHPPFPFPFHQGPGVPPMPPPPPPPVQLHQALAPQPHALSNPSEGQPAHSSTPPIPSAHEHASPSSTPTLHQHASIESIPPSPHSASSLNNGMPSYEEMICMALADLASPDGSAPKAVFEWMTNRFPLMTNFRPSAHQALQKAFKRGRLQKIGNKYRLNPNWSGGSTSRRTTRRPQAAGGAAPPAIPFSARVPGISGSWPISAPPPPTQPPEGNQTPLVSPFPPPFAHPPPPPPHPNPPPNASALLQAIAGINGIIDRSQSEEVSQPEAELLEPEPEPDSQEPDPVEEGDDDAEGETVEGRSSREATDEGRDDRPTITTNGVGPTDANHTEDELRSVLFLLVDQLRAASAQA